MKKNACRQCDAEGREQLNHCKRHNWTYDVWMSGYVDAMTDNKDDHRKV